MAQSLQYRFIETRGGPISIGDATVIQMDRLPIRAGRITVRFVSSNSSLVGGIALEPTEGSLELSDGRQVKLLHIWNEPGLPPECSHQVISKAGELRIWNIYRIKHAANSVTEDNFTGNAGMCVEQLGKRSRRYHCSDGMGEFDPNNLVVDVIWTEDAPQIPSNTSR